MIRRHRKIWQVHRQFSILQVDSKSSQNDRESIQSRDSKMPSFWAQQWAAIECMKSATSIAPVNEFGAESLAFGKLSRLSWNSTPVARSSFRFRTLIAAMLSPQTRDAQTATAFRNLEECVRQASQSSSDAFFTAASLLQVNPEYVVAACAPVSFYKTKARNILLASAQIEKRKYLTTHEQSLEQAGIPTEINDLLSYHGVGPKIAYLTFSVAWGRDEGICVDTHVHRIANRLKWVAAQPFYQKDIQELAFVNAEQTRLQLQQLLPKHYWGAVNGLLVEFGQTICSAKRPKCSSCILRNTCAWCQTQGVARKSE